MKPASNVKWPNGYQPHNHHNCIDSYIEPKDIELWKPCPNCGLKPRVWTFDNGRHTACGCWNTKYDHFSISAESIMSAVKRTGGSTSEYDSDGLRKNWNLWVDTGAIAFDRAEWVRRVKGQRW